MELNRSITSELRLGVLCLGAADMDDTVICFQQNLVSVGVTKICVGDSGAKVL